MDESSSGRDRSSKFGQENFYPNPNTRFKHFSPEKNSRDRFGNRFIASKNLAYYDRDYESTKAGILISEGGEKLIKANSGLLSAIERGLKLLRESPEKYDYNYKGYVELSRGRRMQHLDSGGQSAVYTLELGNKKYIIKTKGPGAPGFVGATQPYVNEMLQVQSLKSDLSSELTKLNLELPNFLFATPLVACVDFVEGTEPTEEELRNKIKPLKELVINYIVRQQSLGNDLWKNITPDFTDQLGGLRTNNFLKTDHGSLIWLDPFLFRA